MPAPLRIAHFVHRYPPALGGSEAYFARLSHYLAGRGHHVTVFTTTALDLEAFRGPGRVLAASASLARSASDGCQPTPRLRSGLVDSDRIDVRRYPLLRLPAQRWLLAAAALIPVRGWQALTLPWNPLSPAMWRAANGNEQFDVVHATAFPYGFPLACARRLARQLGVPFFLTPFLHTGDADDPRDRTRRTFTHPALVDLAVSADRLFVQTEGERQALVALGVLETRLILQGLGVDVDSCTGGDRVVARKAWGFGPDTVVVGHLANLGRAKGTFDLLAAAEKAWSREARFGLVLAGPETAEFRRDWPWPEPDRWQRVRRLGELSDRHKRDFFAGIDVFALPSRIDSFGLVLLEAWANGVPTIGYRAGGIAWVIRDEVDGLLVPCGDVEALERALRRLADDAALRSRLGTAGCGRTQTEFRWEDKLQIVADAIAAAVVR
jgi:glycosyltransferase involved in cell wall biosynthesis